jgi:probable HAF family extracellular repeat protein
MRAGKTHYAESETGAALQAIDLGLFPGGIISLAEGVSANGSVVVGYGDAKDPDPNFTSQEYQAFRWTQTSGMVGLGWIDQTARLSQAFGVSADGSTIVGSDSVQAMRWTQAEGMVGLGKGQGALAARATGISADSSTIIGLNTYNAQNDANRAFRWTAAEGMSDLGVLSGDQFSEARAVSGDGSVVVGVSGIKFVSARAFIWDKTNGMRDLQAVLVQGNPNLANWTLTSADAISADGKTIAGSGTNPNGDREGYTAVLEVHPAKLLNISTRMRVLTGDKVLIGGFIITGTEAKKVIIRGIGPSLANSGLQGVMADPTLELHQGSATIARNDNWKTRPDGSSQQAEIEATTIPPSNDLESAIVMTLNPGNYTAILADKNNGPGLGVVEVYDLAQQSNSKLANISTRGFVDTGDNVMIGGFIAGGGSVGGYAGELVRAIGPSLTGAGVAGALQDTTLELYDGNGVLITSNDNWKLRPDGSSQEADIRATTIPPTDDRESAVVATLAPGNYTAIVRGVNNTTGIAVVEAYALQ